MKNQKIFKINSQIVSYKIFDSKKIDYKNLKNVNFFTVKLNIRYCKLYKY